ncbi:CLUMA_CG004513, isoform A [Clunio marinus]|uniref:CLUMA_CG004513, isoform A n=1 Tax=Clunio marinus TaxID=568069 RepID=A0A1J1HRZ4_9DIPT|nr:CLUMA_CG004513, isoform A [Clunio marinus]
MSIVVQVLVLGMTHNCFQKFHTSVKIFGNEFAKPPKRVISDFLRLQASGMSHHGFQKFIFLMKSLKYQQINSSSSSITEMID